MGALDHPAAGWMIGVVSFLLCLLATGLDVPLIVAFATGHPMLRSQLIAWGHVEARQNFGDSFTSEQALSFGIKRLADTHRIWTCPQK